MIKKFNILLGYHINLTKDQLPLTSKVSTNIIHILLTYHSLMNGELQLFAKP